MKKTNQSKKITSEVEIKEEKSVKEKGEIDNEYYIQVEDDKSYQSYVSLSFNNKGDHTSLNNGEDPTISPSSWSSSSHQRGRGGRGRSSHHGGRGGKGRSSHTNGQGGQGRRHYTRESMEEEHEELTTRQTQLNEYYLASFRVDKIKRIRVSQ